MAGDRNKVATVEIYRNGAKIEAIKFGVYGFYIIKDSGVRQLYWHAGRGQTEKKTQRGGEIVVWIHGIRTIHLVRPDWQLIINGVEYPPRAYMDVDVTGKQVTLRWDQWGKYEFVFQFPEIE